MGELPLQDVAETQAWGVAPWQQWTRRIVVNRAQSMSSCDANLAFTKNGQSLNRLVLLYGLSGFVCVLGFQHVVSQVSRPQECEKH